MKVSLPIGYALIALALLVLAPVQPAIAAGYTIKDIGTLGGTQSVANGINNTGQAVGQASNSSGTYLGFESQTNALVSTGLLPKGTGSTAMAVNASGEVAGTASDSLGFNHAYTFNGSGMHSLSSPAGDISTSAASINSSGEVAGFVENSLGSTHVAVWINGNMSDLGTLGGWTAYGQSINDSGHVAGYSFLAGNVVNHALYWDGTMHDLGTLGGADSFANGVNDSNEVVGYSYLQGDTNIHAFYWNGTMHDIGALSNSSSIAYGVNNSGQIVGQSANVAFLYSNGVMTDLNTLLPANSGWTLYSASAINDSGQIVGWGVVNGQVHGFILNPPVVISAPPPPPAAPTGLTATGTTGQVALTWTASNGANSYNLYRSTSSGTESLYHIGLTSTSYTDTALTNGTVYYYEATAVGTGGESSRSNEATATPPAPAPSPNTASFVKQDTSTQGNWKGVYGADGFNVLTDPSANDPSMPAYAVLTPSGDSAYQWAAPGSTTAKYALQEAAVGSASRLAGVWYSTSSFTLDLNLTDGNTHQVALYVLDWLSAGRGETIKITDASTGALLNSRTVTGFGNGDYEVYNISGHVKITFTLTSGKNCVVSGIFFK